QSEPGKGTTFNVYLPAIYGVPVSERKSESSSVAPRGREPGTVLVVEDQEEVREVILAVLSSEGFNVLAAAGGDAALALSSRYPETIQLLITDLVMPGMNGKQVADQLILMRPNMKVLYISGYSGDLLARRGISEPDAPHLAKPFTPQALSERVREILGSE